jgi:type II protein arginine methyltransferase
VICYCLPVFQTPQYVSGGADVTIELWRASGGGKVWYEWSVASPELSPIHNPKGRSYFIGL